MKAGSMGWMTAEWMDARKDYWMAALSAAQMAFASGSSLVEWSAGMRVIPSADLKAEPWVGKTASLTAWSSAE
jgi:hypothetical protein